MFPSVLSNIAARRPFIRFVLNPEELHRHCRSRVPELTDGRYDAVQRTQPSTCQSGANDMLTKSEKLIAWRSTPLQSRSLFHNRDTTKNEHSTTECNVNMHVFGSKPRFCTKGMSKTHQCSLPFCFPFTISLPTSYHTSPRSHTEITAFFT